MTPHLEGMGVIGCYLAWRLAADGVDFTWNDTEQGINAWRACTGAIFPTGHAEDLEAMAVWRGHLNEPGIGEYMEEAAYLFTQKHPPHGGTYAPYRVTEALQQAPLTSLHLNAQEWVPWTRRAFAGHRTLAAPDGSRRVITHGFGPRLARFMWGWTMPVKLAFDPDAYEPQPGVLRPCLYCREGRFVMANAYPIPNTARWYAGSSRISQRVPKSLAIEAKFRRWREQFLRLTDGYVQGVSRGGQPMFGWRPVPAQGDTAWVTEQPDGSLAARPLWHSGVRHAPHIYNALQEALS